MTQLHLPWLDLMVLAPLLGALVISRHHDAFVARQRSVWVCAITLLLAIGAWQDFELTGAAHADDAWHISTLFFGRELFEMDRLSAPLLPMTALLHFLTAVTTQRTKVRRFSFSAMLFSESLLLATLSTVEPWSIIVFLALGTIPPGLELMARGKSNRVYVFHMAAFVMLLLIGWSFVELEDDSRVHTLWAVLPLLGAVLIRSGMAPVHCWLTDLFENATLGTALLTVTPLIGMYTAARLVLPIAPDWVLQYIGLVSLATAVYASGMALVQREARRFFCYLFLSHSALVLVGLEMVSELGLTGALCLWLSVGLSLGGFGLVLRALEARRGRILLTEFQGLYESTPVLAVCFFLSGLGSIGFPGTLGFVGAELLVDGAVETYPYIGFAVVIASSLNGIAIVKAYFLIFTGTRHASTVSLQIRHRERIAILMLAALIIIGGLFPQPGVMLRSLAARELLARRHGESPPTEVPVTEEHH